MSIEDELRRYSLRVPSPELEQRVREAARPAGGGFWVGIAAAIALIIGVNLWVEWSMPKRAFLAPPEAGVGALRPQPRPAYAVHWQRLIELETESWRG